MSTPQIADCFGKGTHDAKPGELETVIRSKVQSARAYAHHAIAAARDLQRLPFPPQIDQDETIRLLESALEALAKVANP